MTVVLDASVTVAWHFEDEAVPEILAILDGLERDDAVVPSIWLYEVPSTLLVGVRRGRTTMERARAHLRALAALPIEMASPSQTSITTLASKHEISVYDAAYVDIAQARGLPLATLDRRMRAVAAAEGVPVLPESLD